MSHDGSQTIITHPFREKTVLEKYALRWCEAVNNPVAVSILIFLLKAGATNPQSALSYSAIARAINSHKWTVRRIIAGEGGKRRRKSLLQGLVHYPDRYRHTGCYLLPEGVKVASWLAEGKTPTYEELRELAEIRQQRIESHAESHKSHAESHAYLYYYDTLMYVCPTGFSKPVGLAEKLHRVYGMTPSVASIVATCYPKDAIEAAIELTEQKNGNLYNPAGFILHLLKRGYAQRYAEAKRTRQDPDLLAQEVKEAVEAQTGVKVTLIHGSPAVACRHGWLHLPLDAEKAVDLVRRLIPTALSESELDRHDDAPIDREPDPTPTAPMMDDGLDPDDEEAEPSELDDAGDEPESGIDGGFNPFAIYPFAAPSQSKRECPRCGRERSELKRFECRYRQVQDAELKRWDGFEVCFGDPASCWESLTKGEIRLLKQALGIDDNLPPNPANPTADTCADFLADTSKMSAPTLLPSPDRPDPARHAEIPTPSDQPSTPPSPTVPTEPNDPLSDLPDQSDQPSVQPKLSTCPSKLPTTPTVQPKSPEPLVALCPLSFCASEMERRDDGLWVCAGCGRLWEWDGTGRWVEHVVTSDWLRVQQTVSHDAEVA